MQNEQNDNEVKVDEIEDIEMQHRRWSNRRRMAYFSLFSIFMVTYWALFIIPIERLKVLSDVITWFYLVFGSIVGGYVGFSVYEHIKKGK